MNDRENDNRIKDEGRQVQQELEDQLRAFGDTMTDEDSWLSQFNASGAFESVDCQIAGLGEVPSIQELYVAHTKAAIDSLNG